MRKNILEVRTSTVVKILCNKQENKVKNTKKVLRRIIFLSGLFLQESALVNKHAVLEEPPATAKGSLRRAKGKKK